MCDIMVVAMVMADDTMIVAMVTAERPPPVSSVGSPPAPSWLDRRQCGARPRINAVRHSTLPPVPAGLPSGIRRCPNREYVSPTALL